MHQLSKSTWLIVLVCLGSITIHGCGGGSSAAPPPPPPQLATFQLSGPNGSQSFTVAKSALNGGPLNGPGTAWKLMAGNTLMQFTVVATAPWLTVSPTSGTLPAGTSTAIGVISINASSLSCTNYLGGFAVSAPGYQDQTVIAAGLTCVGTDSHGNLLYRVDLP